MSLLASLRGCDRPMTLLLCRACDVLGLPGARVEPGDRSLIITLGKRLAPLVFLVLVAALSAAPGAFADPPGIAAKEAEAEAVMGELQALDSNLERTVQRFDTARSQLHSIQSDLAVNGVNLGVAKRNLKESQAALESRL